MNNQEININEIKKNVNLIRNMVSARKDMTAQINIEMKNIVTKYKIPAKIVRKLFVNNSSVLKDKQEEEHWISILKELL